MGRSFRSRLRPPADDIGQRTARLPFVEAGRTECVGTIQPLERLQRRMRDANRPGIAVREGLDIDPLPVRGLRSVLPALQQAFDDPPRPRPFDVSTTVGSVMTLSVAGFVISASTRGHKSGPSP